MACIYFISECVNEHFIGHCHFPEECGQQPRNDDSTLNTSGALSKYLQIAEDLAKTCDYVTLTGSGQG